MPRESWERLAMRTGLLAEAEANKIARVFLRHGMSMKQYVDMVKGDSDFSTFYVNP